MNIKTTTLLGAVCVTAAASQTVLATQATLVSQTALAITGSLGKN